MDVDRHCDVSSSRTKRVTLRGTYFSVDEKKKRKISRSNLCAALSNLD